MSAASTPCARSWPSSRGGLRLLLTWPCRPTGSANSEIGRAIFEVVRLSGCLLLLAAALASRPVQAFVWPSAPAKIERALKSSDVAERRAASVQLGEMDERTAAPLLRKALADQDIDVRLRAAKSA